jgi:[ribosomal protein S18]-alanine N-acetyltransferase
LIPRSADFAVRRAAAADLEALAEVEAAAFTDPWPAAAIAPFLEGGGGHAWLARARDGQAIGGALVREVAGEAELLRVATVPPWRRRQVARALLAAAFAELDRAGIACHLEVRADNLAAQGLYQELGFVRSGLRRKYYRDDCDAWLYARPAAAPGLPGATAGEFG